MATASKAVKASLGSKVYDILSKGGDEEQMAEEIAKAYIEASEAIAQIEKRAQSVKDL